MWSKSIKKPERNNKICKNAHFGPFGGSFLGQKMAFLGQKWPKKAIFGHFWGVLWLLYIFFYLSIRAETLASERY